MSCRPADINGLETLSLHGGLSPGAPRDGRNGNNTYPIGRDQSARARRRGDRMRRRAFITLLGGAAAWPLAVRAQTASKRPIIGTFVQGTRTQNKGLGFRQSFLDGLRELGD